MPLSLLELMLALDKLALKAEKIKMGLPTPEDGTVIRREIYPSRDSGFFIEKVTTERIMDNIPTDHNPLPPPPLRNPVPQPGAIEEEDDDSVISPMSPIKKRHHISDGMTLLLTIIGIVAGIATPVYLHNVQTAHAEIRPESAAVITVAPEPKPEPIIQGWYPAFKEGTNTIDLGLRSDGVLLWRRRQ